MPTLDPPTEANESRSGGCCKTVGTSTQERSPDKVSDGRPASVRSEESADEPYRYSYYGGSKEENTRHGRVATKDEREDCTSGCCGPKKEEPVNDSNDSCCNDPEPSKGQKSKGEIKVVNVISKTDSTTRMSRCMLLLRRTTFCF